MYVPTICIHYKSDEVTVTLSTYFQYANIMVLFTIIIRFVLIYVGDMSHVLFVKIMIVHLKQPLQNNRTIINYIRYDKCVFNLSYLCKNVLITIICFGGMSNVQCAEVNTILGSIKVPTQLPLKPLGSFT